MRKMVVLLIVLQLVFIPAMVGAQELSQQPTTKGIGEILPDKSLSANVSNEMQPRQSKTGEKNLALKDLVDIPLVDEGDWAGVLQDDYGSYHYIGFDSVNLEGDSLYAKLYYASDDYIKESYIDVVYYQEANSALNYVGYSSFDLSLYDSVFLIPKINQAYFSNQPYIYIKVGVYGDPSDEYYSDVMLFKVMNPYYSDGNQADDDTYAVISNESLDAEYTQPTGIFNLKNKNYTYDENIDPTAYKMDVIKPFDHKKNKLVESNEFTNLQSYNVGDSKNFWVANFVNGSDYTINAVLAYSGSKAQVWVNNNNITAADAQRLGQEFDNRIYSSVANNFGAESDVNGDGKINILCFDIQDGFSGSGGYVGGYFYAGDLFYSPTSNQSEIFYIDTYPAMGTGYTKDVTQAYETLAHEFQHMVNFNRNALIEGGEDMDVWLDEGLAMAAEQIYQGSGLSSRVSYYNTSNAIQSGHSLLYWDYDGDTLSNYSLSYLFGQYIKLQSKRGNSIFKEILQDPNNDYRAVENAAKKYISSDMTMGKLMTSFRAALLLKESTGLHGFMGDSFFNSIETQTYYGSTANLRGGGAIVTTVNSAAGLTVPENKGADITYNFFDMDGSGEGNDVTPPAAPTVNQVSDADNLVSGNAEAGSKIEIKRDGTLIGEGTTGEDGQFSVPIPAQNAGIELSVTAVDAAGNVSTDTVITVVDRTSPAKPIVNEVTNHSTSVTGSAEPNSKIEIKRSGTLIGEGTTGGNGQFSVTIPVQGAGLELSITATDAAGNVSDATKIIVQAGGEVDTTPPAQPIVNELTDYETSLTGTTEPRATVIAKVSGTEIGRAAAGVDGKFTITVAKQSAGKTIEVTATDQSNNVSSKAIITVTSKLQTLIGTTRYSTAVEISKAGWTSANTVLLSNGSAIVDGLTATPLATAKDAPLLLTTKDSLPAETVNELKRLKAKEVILIGGTGVISTQVEGQLKSLGLTVTRIGGSTRYETSLLIAKALDKLVDVNTIYMAYGRGEPDALSIAAHAGQEKQPIILTDKSAVPTATFDWLATENLTNSYFIGGTSAISSSTIEKINTITSQNVISNRISGENRLATNAKIIEKFYTETELQTIMIAKSETEKLVDALAAGPLAAKKGVPVLLVSQAGLHSLQQQVLQSKQYKHVHQIGGGINPDVINSVLN